MSKKLLLAGGGHAHMMTLANLSGFVEKGYQVTVIQPSPFHYYSGMGPGMLCKTYSPEEIRFSTKQVVEKQGGTFILDKVTRIEPDSSLVHLESGETVPYDTLSCNVGSYVPSTIISEQSENIFTVKPIERLETAQKKILQLSAEKTIKVSIIGGGASTVEIAGNVWGLTNRPGIHPADIKIFARTTIMGNFPDQVRLRAVTSLSNRDIAIFEHCPVARIQQDTIELKSGKTYDADIIFLATGVKPSPVFGKSGVAVGPDGGLMVNKYLQSVDYPNIFGGGDCIYFKNDPLDKVGVYAVRENPILLHNLTASLEETELKEFEPGGDYLLILNLGDGTGIFRKKSLLFGGRPAFWLKDYIDRKFMKKFQSLEN